MKLGLKLIVIVLVLVFVGSYAIFAVYYQGKYNMDTTLTLNVDDNGNVGIAGFDYDCDQVTYGDFWSLFKGHELPDDMTGYMVYYTLNQSGETSTWIQSAIVPNGESSEIELSMKNLSPGSGTVEISIHSSTGAVLLTRTFPVVVGP